LYGHKPNKEPFLMSIKSLIATCLAALLIVPAVALAGTDTAPGQNKTTTSNTAPNGNAYGVYCKGFSKKHVKGTKGTPFSRCVKAMAKVATPPGCVKAAAKLKKDLPKTQ
jgi:hypothetical protein